MPPESHYISNRLRATITDRAHNHCEYCLCPADYSSDSFTIDHIQPRQSGGPTTFENLAWACAGCNGFKQARTSALDPETQQETEFFNPRTQNWREHFAWSEDYSQVIGINACGRATIAALKLNRNGVKNLRRLLAGAGLHPPTFLN